MNTFEDEEAFDFNDLETDERVNIDIVTFAKGFPDPQSYCLGFFTQEIAA
jgi:hypothetical protein